MVHNYLSEARLRFEKDRGMKVLQAEERKGREGRASVQRAGAKGAPGPPTCAHNATSCSSRRAKGDCRARSRPAPSPSSTLSPPSQRPTRVSPSCQPVDCLVQVHLVYPAYLGTDVSTLETPPSTRIRQIQAPAIKRQGSV